MSTGRKHIVWRVRPAIRKMLIIVALFTALPASHSRRAAVACRPEVAQAYFPEVRLRKLHLVRPDLIPYPIFYEVYC